MVYVVGVFLWSNDMVLSVICFSTKTLQRYYNSLF